MPCDHRDQSRRSPPTSPHVSPSRWSGYLKKTVKSVSAPSTRHPCRARGGQVKRREERGRHAEADLPSSASSRRLPRSARLDAISKAQIERGYRLSSCSAAAEQPMRWKSKRCLFAGTKGTSTTSRSSGCGVRDALIDSCARVLRGAGGECRTTTKAECRRAGRSDRQFKSSSSRRGAAAPGNRSHRRDADERGEGAPRQTWRRSTGDGRRSERILRDASQRPGNEEDHA